MDEDDATEEGDDTGPLDGELGAEERAKAGGGDGGVEGGELGEEPIANSAILAPMLDSFLS